MVINSYIAGSEAPGKTSDGTAGRVSVAWRDRMWDASTLFKRVDDSFDPGMGFIHRRALEHTFATLGVHPRPNIPHIQEVNPYVKVDYITNLDRLLETRTLAAGTVVLLQPDGQFDTEVRDQYERVPRPFEILPGDTVYPGAYAWREATAGYTSSGARALSRNMRVTAGDFYDGSRRTIAFGTTWRPRYDVFVENLLAAQHGRPPARLVRRRRRVRSYAILVVDGAVRQCIRAIQRPDEAARDERADQPSLRTDERRVPRLHGTSQSGRRDHERAVRSAQGDEAVRVLTG